MPVEKHTQLLCYAVALPFLCYTCWTWLLPETTIPITILGFSSLLYTRLLVQLIQTTFSSPLLALPLAPEDTLIAGHALKILKRPSVETVLRWMQTTKNDGLLRISGMLHWKHAVIVTSPAVAYEVLTTKASMFHKPPHVRNWLFTLMGSGGLITSEGHEHAVQRKQLNRVFTNTATRNLVPLFYSKACRLTDEVSGRLAAQQSGGSADGKQSSPVVDLAPLSAGITLDIISVAIFGRDLNCVSNMDEPMHRAWSFMANPDTTDGRLATYFTLSCLLPPWLTRNYPSAFVKTFNGYRQWLRNRCMEIVTERRQDTHQDERKDILSLIAQDQSKSNDATDAQIVDQMLTLLAAGHDTTSGTFLWAIWLIAHHVDIQSRMRSEVQGLLTELDGRPEELDGHDLDRLPYTMAVAHEVMRLFPTIAMTVRQPQTDVIVNGSVIPKGTRMYISPWAMQRMPDFWSEDAGEFQPDRWLDADGKFDTSGNARVPHAFLTFINGPRSCIGQYFARNELMCLLVALIGKFEIDRRQEDAGKLEMTGILTIQPKGGMNVALKEVAAAW